MRFLSASHTTTALDLGTALRFSRMVTPRKPRVLEAIDEAIRECKAACRTAVGMEHFNDADAALGHLYSARRLLAGERA